MGNLAIIPARGGSKRIPGKNIRNFLGKPIIAYSISAALESNLFDEVMVSTDSEEIAIVAREYGAQIPFMRSDENADDHATTAEVITEVLKMYEKEGKQFENACCIYPCSPLLKKESLREAFSKLQRGFNSVLPIVAFGYPIQRALRTVGEKISWSNPQNALTRSQDLEAYYHDCGQFYWLKVEAFQKIGALLTANTGYIILKGIDVQDIDNEIDWKLAELK